MLRLSRLLASASPTPRLVVAVLDDYQNYFSSSTAVHLLQQAGVLSTVQLLSLQQSVKDPRALAAALQQQCKASYGLPGPEILVLTQQRTPITRDLVKLLSGSLKLICQTGRNTSHIDMQACRDFNVSVQVGGHSSPEVTAELAWTLILCSLRNIVGEAQSLRSGKWQDGSALPGTRAHGKVLGIYGLGRIGSIVATYGKAFGMKVLCHGRDNTKKAAQELGYAYESSREEFFRNCDIVTLHLPLNQATTGIVKLSDLRMMKSSALIVNTSRAQLIESGALVNALNEGHPGFAAVDVYEEEPPNLKALEPLLEKRNVICTPHLGYSEQANLDGLYEAIADMIIAYVGKEHSV